MIDITLFFMNTLNLFLLAYIIYRITRVEEKGDPNSPIFPIIRRSTRRKPKVNDDRKAYEAELD